MAILFEGNQDPYGIQSIGQSLNPLWQALGQSIQNKRQQASNISQGSTLNKIFTDLVAKKGEDVSGVDIIRALTQAQQQGVSPEAFKQYEPFINEMMKQQGVAKKEAAARQKELQPFKSGLNSVQQMKQLIPDLGTANALKIKALPANRAAAQKYTTLGNSILGLLTSIPIRNQSEFDTIKHGLSSPYATQAELKAALDAAEDIIRSHIEGGGEIPEMGKTSEPQQSEKTINIRDTTTGKVEPIPISEWEKLTEAAREGYEAI